MSTSLVRAFKRFARTIVPGPVLERRKLWLIRKFAKARGIDLTERDLFYDLRRANTVLRVGARHTFYLQHMIEKFDVYTRSVFPVHIDGTLLVDMSGPRFHRLKGFGDIPFLFPSHAEPYETTTDYLDFAALRPGEVVLDIGAYSAVTSIIFAKAVGSQGRVYAFEPDEVNFECARINTEMAKSVMGLDNITLINKAVWSDGEGILFSHEGGMGSSAVTITGKNRGHEGCVPSIRVQDFIRENGLDRVNFVKVDVEGCEIELLASSALFLRDIGARLVVEPHNINGVLSTERCRALLESVGYHVHVRAEVGESEALIEATP